MIMGINHSFRHWCILTHCMLLLSLCKTLNIFRTSSFSFKIKAIMVRSPMYICSKSYYIRFHMDIMSSTYLWPSLSASLYLHDKSVKLLYLCMCHQLSCVSVWSLTFTEKSDQDEINHVISMISITAILVKPLHMIWCYIASFVMSQTVWLFLHLQKICISHHDGITSRLVLEEGPVITGS